MAPTTAVALRLFVNVGAAPEEAFVVYTNRANPGLFAAT